MLSSVTTMLPSGMFSMYQRAASRLGALSSAVSAVCSFGAQCSGSVSSPAVTMLATATRRIQVPSTAGSAAAGSGAANEADVGADARVRADIGGRRDSERVSTAGAGSRGGSWSALPAMSPERSRAALAVGGR